MLPHLPGHGDHRLPGKRGYYRERPSDRSQRVPVRRFAHDGILELSRLTERTRLSYSRGPHHSDPDLKKFNFKIDRRQQHGRSHGWAKILSKGVNRKGALNIEWDADTNMLLCRVANPGAGRPNLIVGGGSAAPPCPPRRLFGSLRPLKNSRTTALLAMCST